MTSLKKQTQKVAKPTDLRKFKRQQEKSLREIENLKAKLFIAENEIRNSKANFEKQILLLKRLAVKRIPSSNSKDVEMLKKEIAVLKLQVKAFQEKHKQPAQSMINKTGLKIIMGNKQIEVKKNDYRIKNKLSFPKKFKDTPVLFIVNKKFPSWEIYPLNTTKTQSEIQIKSRRRIQKGKYTITWIAIGE